MRSYRQEPTRVSLLLTLAVMISLCSCDHTPTDSGPVQPPVQCGAGGETDPQGEPIGGGHGYSRVVDPTDPEVAAVVDNALDLKRELESASAGDIVYVSDDAEIDLYDSATGDVVPLPIRMSTDRVVLASGRGRAPSSQGALLRYKVPNTTGDAERRGLLEVTADGVRITGLRIEGPSTTTEMYDIWTGIGVEDVAAGVEVDNCEIFGWTHAGVWLKNSRGFIHHNLLRDNPRKELGYGVSLAEGSYATIRANRFDQNRHHISGLGNGPPGRLDSYEACYNIVERFAGSHGFDMHAGAGGVQIHAGRSIHIHHNTFTSEAYTAVRIRGIPEDLCRIEYNDFSLHENEEDAIRQTNHFGNFRAAHNCCGASARGLYVSWGSTGCWYRIATGEDLPGNLAVGDLDGDGQEDLFKVQEGQGWVTSMHRTLYARNGALWGPSGGSGLWDVYLTTEHSLDALALADFDGDTRADLLSRGPDGCFYVSFGRGDGATDPWVPYADSKGSAVREVGFGDFDGDGRADILRYEEGDTLGVWSVAYGVDRNGSTELPIEWACLNASGLPVNRLAFGRFTGNDARTDVFTADGVLWLVSDGGTSPWQVYGVSTVPMGELAFGDFGDGSGGEPDGVTDVFAAWGGVWRVDFGRGDGTNTGWQEIGQSNVGVRGLVFGDFDGDGRTDVITSMVPADP